MACIEAARLAWAYRQRFQLDFLIDLVGYRRYGHNEGDEPAFTQPEIYKVVGSHPTVREIYARQLTADGAVDAEAADAMVKRHMTRLEEAYAALKPEKDYVPPLPEIPPSGAARRAQTAVAIDRLRALNRDLMRVPDGLHGAPQARTGARTPAVDARATRTNGRLTGPRPKSSRWPRFSRMACRFA